MLRQILANHDIADSQTRLCSAGNSAVNHTAGTEGVDQHLGSTRRIHLSHAALYQHRRDFSETAAVELVSVKHNILPVPKLRQQVLQLHLQRADDSHRPRT